MTGQRFWTGGFISHVQWCHPVELNPKFIRKVFLQPFVVNTTVSYASAGTNEVARIWQECELIGFFKRKQPTNLNPTVARTVRHPPKFNVCCVKAVLGGAFKKQPFLLRPLRKLFGRWMVDGCFFRRTQGGSFRLMDVQQLTRANVITFRMEKHFSPVDTS